MGFPCSFPCSWHMAGMACGVSHPNKVPNSLPSYCRRKLSANFSRTFMTWIVPSLKDDPLAEGLDYKPSFSLGIFQNWMISLIRPRICWSLHHKSEPRLVIRAQRAPQDAKCTLPSQLTKYTGELSLNTYLNEPAEFYIHISNTRLGTKCYICKTPCRSCVFHKKNI